MVGGTGPAPRAAPRAPRARNESSTLAGVIWRWRRLGGWRQPLAAGVAVVFLLPLWALFAGSLREPGESPPRTLELLPDRLSAAAYVDAFQLVDLLRMTVNSLLVAGFVVPLATLVASMAGFGILQLGARWRRLALIACFGALMVPVTALIVPRFALFRTLGLIDTWAPLVAPALIGMSPFYVLLFYWSYRRIPHTLFEAARLEGLSPLGVWRRVALPLGRPVVAAVAALVFIASWGNVIEPLAYIFDTDLFTLPLGLRSLASLDRTNYPVLLAAAAVATLPVIVVFTIAQRAFLHEDRGFGWRGR